MHWINEYMDIPFKDHGRDRYGLDCYGLLCFLYMVRLGITLNSYADVYTNRKDIKGYAPKIRYETENNWTKIDPGKEKDYDVVVMRYDNLPMHIGMVIKKNTLVHIEDGIGMEVIQYDRGQWKTPGKIIGFYRHKDLCIEN